MRIVTPEPHATILHFRDGSSLLFSYRNCVAGALPSVGAFITAQNHGATTQHHVAAYLNGSEPDAILPQDYIDFLVGCI